MTPIERMKRIAELQALITSKKATPAQTEEFKTLMAEQMAWSKANPAESMQATRTFELLQKSPEEARAEYDAARAEYESTRPLTKAEEDARTAAGQAARAEAIRSGKSPAVADSIALDVYTKWRPPAPAPSAPSGPAPEGDSFQRHYTAMGEAVEKDYRDFALYMRELADKGELVDAEGKPLPMYSKDKIANMTLEELKAFTASNPRYARTFFKEPPAEVAEQLKGTGRTGIGAESGMVELPPIPASAPAKPETPAPAPETPKPEEPAPEDPKSEATMVGAGGGATTPEEPKKKKFGEMAGELYNKYGVPFLEIVEAVGKQRGGIDKPTMLDKKYAEKLTAQEREYVKRLEEEKAARDEAAYAKRMADQRAWEEQQEKARQAYETAQSTAGYGQQEKLLRMQLEAQRAAARAGGGSSASIIPD